MSQATAKKRKPQSEAIAEGAPFMMWELLRAFIWMDRGLQKNMEARGWKPLSRTESQVMLLTSVGIVRPIEIARNLDITRQAINQTLSQLVEKKLVELKADPEDKRCKIVCFAKEGMVMRADAQKVLRGLEAELTRRGGAKHINMMRDMENWDWDAPPIVE